MERQEIGLLGGCRLGACCVHRVCARRTLYFSEGWASLGEGFGRRTAALSTDCLYIVHDKGSLSGRCA